MVLIFATTLTDPHIEEAETESPPIPLPAVSSTPAIRTITTNQYENISVRWAILYLLTEHAIRPISATEIADSLRSGGNLSVSSNVSAVLRQMVNQRSEVEQSERGYQITPQGRDAWNGAKQTPQWHNRPNGHAS